MTDDRSALLRPRRIGVTGAVPGAEPAIERSFCAAVGETLARRDAVIVTRGGKASAPPRGRRRTRSPVDELVVDAASAVLETTGGRPESAIETVLSEVASDRAQFHVGTLTRVRGRTFEAERFAFVARLDGLIGIGGRGGTEQTLILALATERPILPVPLFGGAGRAVWDDHQGDLATSLGLEPAGLQRWLATPGDTDAAAALAQEMVERFLDGMARRCFVVMPFHESHSALYDFVIAPAVEGLGDRPVRLDRVAIPGDVGRQIDQGIQRADYVVVVLDGFRPNVLYELGLAHGRGKPTILMNRQGSVGPESLDAGAIPFDLTMQQRLEYAEIDRHLPDRLQAAIRALGRL